MQGKEFSRKIWIDLDNSPHVPFFYPISNRLSRLGHAARITVRDCFQVCGLADRYNLKYEIIGKHYGKHKVLKVFGTIFRAFQLIIYARKDKPDLAVSHGSRSMLIAAKTLNIPKVILIDYEYSTALPFFKPDLWIGPEILDMTKYANGISKVASYPGIKEDVYVPYFIPDASIMDNFAFDSGKIIVTIRPPATEAHYHNPESEILFSEVMNILGSKDDVRMVILPRNEVKQTAWIKRNWRDLVESGKIVIPEKVLDGLNLIWFSDFVVSGGGTMNREAAALGVPVYSIFRGKIGAVDRYLSENNRLVLLTSRGDPRAKIKIEKRSKKLYKSNGESPALDTIVRLINGFRNE